MDNETCEGYKNYPTFAVAVEIQNDRGTHDYWHNLAAETIALTVPQSGTLTTREVALIRLAELLKAHHEAEAERANVEADLSDLLSYALGQVDWHEIATQLVETVEESPEEYGVTA